MSKFKKYSFLEETVNISFPEGWKVEFKDSNLAEVQFPFGPYPTLGCYLKCFDGPKINSEEKIKEYLLEGIDNQSTLKKYGDYTYILKYEFKAADEKLILWKILYYLKPRSYREVRLSIAWPDKEEANILINSIVESMSEVINKIKFNKEKTIHDEAATIGYKLENIKLKKYNLWNALNIYLPERWEVKRDKEEKLANIEISDKNNFNFFCEYFNITRKTNIGSKDSVVTKFLEEITKDVSILNENLIKSDNDNYIFSFYSLEKVNDSEMINHIWYRLHLKSSKLLIASFVFNYSKKNQIIGKVYKQKIDSLIKSSELI